MESINLVAPLLPAVGRIAGRGSCILLSMTPDLVESGLRRAIILTTSHVISKRVEAHGLEATFFEHPMQGMQDRQKHPVVVLLRPEHVFLTSAEDPKTKQQQQQSKSSVNGDGATGGLSAGGDANSGGVRNNSGSTGADGKNNSATSSNDSIGYTIVACDVDGRNFDMNVVRSSSGRVSYARTSEYDTYGTTTKRMSKYRPLYTSTNSNSNNNGSSSNPASDSAMLAGSVNRATFLTHSAADSINFEADERRRHEEERAAELAKLPPASIASMMPIGLPLVQSRCPAVKKGDSHLVVTHASGGPSRKIYTLTVGEAYDNYCVYNEVDTTAMFSSGGVVFSGETGDFIGLQHQSPGPDCSHYCMYIREITQHLFLSHSLGLVQVPILDGNVEDIGGMVGTVAKSIMDRDTYVLGEEPLWKRQRDALNRGNPVDHVTQSSAPHGRGVLTTESRQLHVRERARYGGDFSQLVDYQELEREWKLRARYVPPTLLVADHLEVFQHYYDRSRYASLVHMVGCFGYHPLLTKLILTRLISHEHRNELCDFSEHHGMPPLLELLERNASNGDIVQAGMTALGRLTQYELNREALNRYNGLQTLLALLRGWPNTSNIVDWGCFCLLNMSSSNTLRHRENVKQIAEQGGVALLVGFVRDLGISSGPGRSGHIVRWGLQALCNCIGDDKRVFDLAMEAGICSVVIDALVQYADSTYSLLGPAACLVQLVHLEMFDAAVDYLISAGALSVLVSILRSIANNHLRLLSSSSSSSSSGAGGGGDLGNAGRGRTGSFSYAGGTAEGTRDDGHNKSSSSSSANNGTGGGGASIGTDTQVAQHLLTALGHIVENRGPQIRLELTKLGCAEVSAACARAFPKETELVNVVATLVSALGNY